MLGFRSNSRAAEAAESLPWEAFLGPPVPKSARMLSGASAFAVSTLVGPIMARQVETAFLPTSSLRAQTRRYVGFGFDYDCFPRETVDVHDKN